MSTPAGSISSTAARRCTARITRCAARGLLRPRRAADQRRLHLRHDAAQAAQRAQAAVSSPRRSICRAAPSATISSTDYKANRTPMPDELARADPDGPRRLRGARRADPHLRALRSRRRDRHAGDEGGAPPASTSRSSPATRTSFSSSATASASSTRATKAPGTTPTAVKEKFGVAPEQVVDVLALMGDTIDNIKGVPGIGEKGARELIATYGSLENLLAHAAEVTNKRYREGLLAHADDARQSRELARIRTDVPVRVRRRGAALPRRVARALLRDLQRARLPRRWSMEFAPTADTIGKNYRDRRHRRGRARARRRRCARPAGSRCACCRIGPTAMRAGDRRPRVLDRAARGATTCRSSAGRSDGDLFDDAGTPTATAAICRAALDGARGRCSRTRRSRRSATT